MKLAILGDLHIISPQDEFAPFLPQRDHFKQTWRSFQDVCRLLRNESVDFIVSLGDVVDWYSEANRDFALEQLQHLPAPWAMTPGNHDLATYEWNEENVPRPDSSADSHRVAHQGWQTAGVDTNHRVIDLPDAQLILVSSGAQVMTQDDRRWLSEVLERVDPTRPSFVCTHIPFNTEPMKQHIRSINPRHDPEKSLQQGEENLFELFINGKVDRVFSAHLHQFPGSFEAGGIPVHSLPLSVVATGRAYPRQGTVTIVDTRDLKPRFLSIAEG